MLRSAFRRAKYQSFRHPLDSIQLLHSLRRFPNKLVRRGKRAVMLRQFDTFLRAYRFEIRRPTYRIAVLRILRTLRLPFVLLSRRKSSQMLGVPTPVRRNRRDRLALHLLSSAVIKRPERTLWQRCLNELLELIGHQHAPTLRHRSAYLAKIHDERTNEDLRWK